MFSMGLFEKYDPVDLKTNPDIKHVERDYMVLDSATIQNLSLLGGKGTLQQTLNFCKTPFGKRLVVERSYSLMTYLFFIYLKIVASVDM